VAWRSGDGRLVRVLGSGLQSGFGDPTATGHFEVDRTTARAAYEQAGVDPSDIDVAEVHDAFTATEVMHYEDLMLCPPGEGPKYVADGHTALGGRIPVSTSGGLLSKGHPLGATGIAQIHEIVTQLRGEARERQVPGARVGLAHCAGGFLDGDVAVSAVHILGR
jgi:acetyl-CoA acetyltransferase